MSETFHRVDPATWSAILTKSHDLLNGPDSWEAKRRENRAKRVFDRMLLECAPHEIGLPLNPSDFEVAPKDPNEWYVFYGSNADNPIRAARLNKLVIQQRFGVNRVVKGHAVLNTNRVRYEVRVGQETTGERFGYTQDPSSLRHQLLDPSLYDLAQGELTEANPCQRLAAFLLQGCEPAYLPKQP